MKLKKIVGASALSAISIVELLHLQSASATPVVFTGSTFSNPRGGSVQVAITVDGSSGTCRITSIATPLQPGGRNSSYSSYAIPTLTSEALTAQSAAINGISGASQISAAWQASLASAISAAAAAGETIGGKTETVPSTPTPTATVLPTPSPTAKAIAPGGVPNFKSYLAQLNLLLAQLTQGGDDDHLSTAVLRNELSALEEQIAAEEIQYQAAQSKTSNPTPVPTVTVTVTAHPLPSAPPAVPSAPPVVLKIGGSIRKTLTCVKTVAGKTTTKVVTGFIVQCPAGYKPLKK